MRIATATACMVNCFCVAHAHVFVGCSNLSPHPVWDSPSPELHTWLRNPSSPVAMRNCTTNTCTPTTTTTTSTREAQKARTVVANTPSASSVLKPSAHSNSASSKWIRHTHVVKKITTYCDDLSTVAALSEESTTIAVRVANTMTSQ